MTTITQTQPLLQRENDTNLKMKSLLRERHPQTNIVERLSSEHVPPQYLRWLRAKIEHDSQSGLWILHYAPNTFLMTQPNIMINNQKFRRIIAGYETLENFSNTTAANMGFSNKDPQGNSYGCNLPLAIEMRYGFTPSPDGKVSLALYQPRR